MALDVVPIWAAIAWRYWRIEGLSIAATTEQLVRRGYLVSTCDVAELLHELAGRQLERLGS